MNLVRGPEEVSDKSSDMRENILKLHSMKHVMQNTIQADTRVNTDMQNGHPATKHLKVLPSQSLPNQRKLNIHQENVMIFDIDTGASKGEKEDKGQDMIPWQQR